MSFFFTIDIEFFFMINNECNNFFLASCLAVMALTNGVLKLVLLYLASCKSHAPPSITVQSGLTEGKSVPYLAQSINRFIEKRKKLFVVIDID